MLPRPSLRSVCSPHSRRPSPFIHRSIPGRTQGGFTLVELTVVLIALAILLGAVVTVATSEINKAYLHNAKELLTRQMVQEVAGKYAATLTLSGVTKTELIANGNLSASSPWGDTWTVTSTSARSVTIAYPMDSASDTDGNNLATYLGGITAHTMISSAVYNTTTNVLTVVYTV